MLVIGIVMIVLAVAMVVAGFLLPDVAKPGLFGGAIGVGLGGLVLTYLSWPSRSSQPRDGKVKADAYVLDARLTGGEATGYRMVEMTLEVRPKDGIPFQVKRKFIADMWRIETGQKIKVFYDPANPEKLERA